MTICIAAICEKGQRVVLVADRMTTASIPMGFEFESEEVPKILKLTDEIYLMTAGNSLHANEIYRRSIQKIQQSSAGLTVKAISEVTRIEYQLFRRERVIQRTLEPRGLSLQDFYTLQQKMHQALVMQIDSILTSESIGVDLIVVGKDSTGSHIFSISHPGVSDQHDPIGFVAVGSGAPHAMYSLIGSGYKPSLPLKDAMELINEAKRKSEVAPGVGRETTTLVIPPESPHNCVSKEASPAPVAESKI
ncbi:MAG: hypothetical protein Q8N84_02480 [bacterium]|nr:hypothetical protein [bacterium]